MMTVMFVLTKFTFKYLAGCPKEQHGKVRLVGGRESDIGRLELCFEGDWSPFLTNSGFGYNEGATACKQLGFLEYPSERQYKTLSICYTHTSHACAHNINKYKIRL